MNRRASRTRSSGARLALAVVLVLASACRRKAPGPAECREFAYRVVGVQSDEELRIPGVQKRVDDFTTECLVTPFDRELLACVEQGQSTRLCIRDFDLRHPTNAPAALPRVERRPRTEPFP